MIEYDAAIIEKFAERLYKEADSIVWNDTLAGLLLGGLAGFIVFAPFLSLAAVFPAGIGGVVCAVIG